MNQQSKWYKSGVGQFKKGNPCVPPYRALQQEGAEKLWRQGYADAANGKAKG